MKLSIAAIALLSVVSLVAAQPTDHLGKRGLQDLFKKKAPAQDVSNIDDDSLPTFEQATTSEVTQVAPVKSKGHFFKKLFGGAKFDFAKWKPVSKKAAKSTKVDTILVNVKKYTLYHLLILFLLLDFERRIRRFGLRNHL